MNIQDIKKLREDATQGEWVIRSSTEPYLGGCVTVVKMLQDNGVPVPIKYDVNLGYIAALHNFLPQLIEAYEIRGEALEHQHKGLLKIAKYADGSIPSNAEMVVIRNMAELAMQQQALEASGKLTDDLNK